MRRDRCRSCQAPIVWATTRNGKSMPVDADPSPDGNVALAEVGGRVMASVTSGPTLALEALHMPHHATCPHADRWRNRP